MFRRGDGEMALALGFVDQADDLWKIGQMAGPSAEEFDAESFRTVLAPEFEGVAGVKDPTVVQVGGTYHMLVSYHRVTPEERGDPSLKRLADTLATGAGTSNTGLATSRDGLDWRWQGDVLSPRPGKWDAFCSRVTGILPAGLGFLGFYDGSADVSQNYEERGSLAWSADLRSFIPLDTAGPLFVSPHGSGSVRYVDALAVGGVTYLYYEYCRVDGAHQLRAMRLG